MFTNTKEIRIETSTVCNYSCVMCAREQFMRPREIMSNELFRLILHKVKLSKLDIQMATLSGFGEFSLDPEWRLKLKLLRDNFEKIFVVTNFSMMQNPDIDFLLQNVDVLRISICGLDNDTYKGMHRPPDWFDYDELISQINYAISQQRKNQRIVLSFIEHSFNEHQTEQWIKEWKDKVDLIEVWKPHNWSEALKFRNLTDYRQPTCGRPFNGPIQVQVDGTVIVCGFDINGRLVIGDLKKKMASLEVIFKSEIMNIIQNVHRKDADLINLCKICDQRNSHKSKVEELVYSSKFNKEDRVKLTSTFYKKINE